ncbi:hypothetical protein F2Q69_00019698 [Brassica cretica]|uniref:Uncharacterized protein n=1 Tax=Brassica cretica TaxID=69181 RepID=A0A8S9Q8K9_BRACR|nr:hypothetical protein F2Q69_00019698 [Brassica cretica]
MRHVEDIHKSKKLKALIPGDQLLCKPWSRFINQNRFVVIYTKAWNHSDSQRCGVMGVYWGYHNHILHNYKNSLLQPYLAQQYFLQEDERRMGVFSREEIFKKEKWFFNTVGNK